MKTHDTQSIFSFNLKTRKFKREFHHQDVDVTRVILGPKGEVLGVKYNPGYPSHFYFEEENTEVKLLNNLSKVYPTQIVEVSNYSFDGLYAIVKVFSAKNPGDFYLFERNSANLRYLGSANPKIDPKKMSEVEAFTLYARDGIKLYGNLTLPIQSQKKNLPLIVMPYNSHFMTGNKWDFNKSAQFFANQGFAVIQVNVRGSSGFGEDFKRAGYNEWGSKMQDDITDATLWAIKEGVADNNRICLYGESYGGYAAIQGLIREPDLYKCGVSISGFYDITEFTNKKNFSSSRFYYSNYWLKNYFGDNEELYKNISPVFNVNKIKAAILLIHGENDQLIPIEQAETLMKQLNKIGKNYESLILQEDHGFSQLKNKTKQYNKIINFINKHTGLE